MKPLSFGKGNGKLDKTTATFSLPAGHTCLFARECLSKADRDAGTITDGPETKFRCFAASGEALYTNARESRWDNYDALKAAYAEGGEDAVVDLINASLPRYKRSGLLKDWIRFVRVHVSGDFFALWYLRAWLRVAAMNPSVVFYAYTKALPLVKAVQGSIPDNFIFTASAGGTHDSLADEMNLRQAVVVFSHEEATEKNLAIDKDDSHARTPGPTFGLLIHGTQPKGSDAAKALRALRK